MARRGPIIRIRSLLSMLLVLGLLASFISIPVYAQTAAPTIATDLPDYPPNGTVILTGANWAPGEAVTIIVNDTIGQSWQLIMFVTADEFGSFVCDFTLPAYFISDYTVTATGTVSGTATTTFTDMSVGTYDQCANGTGNGPTCNWINGNLQHTNSSYPEGDATVQRLWLTALLPGSHTVTFDYGTTKGGKHAYDFLTSWDWSEKWITLADQCQGITGCEMASETYTGIPLDANAGGFDSAADLIQAREFTMRGGALTGAAFATPIPFTGSYAGDSDTRVTVTFTVPASGSMCTTNNKGVTTCDVVLWFGAHVATQANWGAGMGAGEISGSPYHVSLALVDGASAGSRDNQMQASAITFIPNGTIVIVKDAVPDDLQDFSFNLNNNGTITQNFTLDDDADATLPNSQTFSVPPGTWTASELNIPLGWNLKSVVCVDPTSNTTTNLAAGTATINLASSETVTCTFTNEIASYNPNGTIKIIKDAVPDDSQDFEFSLTSFPNFFLDDDNDPTLSNTKSIDVTPGTSYTVTELSTAGWNLTGLTCSVAKTSGSGTTSSTYTSDLDARTVSFITVANETITCTYTNTKQPKLTVNKVVVPSNDSGIFNLLIDGSAKATNVGNGGTTGAVIVSIGSHTVSETAGTGTDLNNYVTTFTGDCDTNGNVSVTANSSKTCTITNTRKGTIIVEKQTNPDGAIGNFTFTGDAAGTISDNGQIVVGNLDPGTYTSTESALAADFSLESITCDDGSSTTPSIVDLSTKTATFKLDPGETVKCTFTNTNKVLGYPAHLKLVKHVTNDNGGTAVATDWTLTADGTKTYSGSGGFDLNVDADTYSLSETSLPNYIAGNWSCTGGTFTSPNEIKLENEPGKNTATCEITNNDIPTSTNGTIIIKKYMTGGTDSFVYSGNPAGTISADGGTISANVTPGKYTSTEAIKSGWELQSITCSDTNSTNDVSTRTATFNVEAGETVTCTFTNSKTGTPVVVGGDIYNSNKLLLLAPWLLLIAALGVGTAVLARRRVFVRKEIRKP